MKRCFFILEGSGEIRMGAETYPVTKGDVIACPPGGPDTAHQLINTSESDGKATVMRYIIRDQACMAEYWEGE